MRRNFGSKRDESEEWERFRNEEMHILYLSPNRATVIKSRRLRWAGVSAEWKKLGVHLKF